MAVLQSMYLNNKILLLEIHGVIQVKGMREALFTVGKFVTSFFEVMAHKACSLLCCIFYVSTMQHTFCL